MSLNALVAPLRRVPLFADLKPHQLMALVRAADRVIFEPGQTIIAEDRPGDSAYLIMHGDAELVDDDAGADIAIRLETHTLLGEMAMLIETDYSATVVARTLVRALKFNRASITELMEQDAGLAEHFVAVISGRLSSVASELRRVDQMLAEQSAILGSMITPSEAAPM